MKRGFVIFFIVGLLLYLTVISAESFYILDVTNVKQFGEAFNPLNVGDVKQFDEIKTTFIQEIKGFGNIPEQGNITSKYQNIINNSNKQNNLKKNKSDILNNISKEDISRAIDPSSSQSNNKFNNAKKLKSSDILLTEANLISSKDNNWAQVINLSLEETYDFKFDKNKFDKKNSSLLNNVNKGGIPKLVNKRNVDRKDIQKLLEVDNKFRDVKSYAEERGLLNLEDPIFMEYDNGAMAWVSKYKTDDGNQSFLVKFLFENESQSFIIDFDFREEINNTYITFSGPEWGVTIDMNNNSIIEGWGHHSCTPYDCFIYALEYFLTPGSFDIISLFCEGICKVGGNYVAGSACLACVIGLGGGAILVCNGEGTACAYYPCQADCNDGDHYNPWEYRCVGDDRYRQRLFYDYSCSSSAPMQGSCQQDIYYVDDQFIESCSYGCSSGQCLGQVTCYSDIECGQDGWLSSPFCSAGDVRQYYREYSCNYAGTEDSYCTYSDDIEIKQDCSGGSCDNGQCVGDLFCVAQDPDYPFYCNGVCAGSADNENFTVCCPSSGDPQYACSNNGPYCETSTGTCTVCGGDYADSCNDQCWLNAPTGFELCCPSSGDPQYYCNSAASVCISDGNCCVPSTETCNNLDDNCDEIIDSFDEGCGLGVCSGGTRTCSIGAWGSCSTDGLASSETCNNLDDNCDGSVDESISQECGTDVGVCVKGTETCSAGQFGSCGGAYVGPTNETCNGLDDNCNGIIDEGNVCGDYPNVTLSSPIENYVSDTGNITFVCNITDDYNLDNITLLHDLNGSFLLNETRTISGTSDSETWTFNNISIGNYNWNCLAYDNDTHWSLAEDGPYSFSVTIPGLINTFADGSYIKNFSFESSGKKWAYLRVPGDVNITSAIVNITGFSKEYVEHSYYWNFSNPASGDFPISTYVISYTPDNSGFKFYDLTAPSRLNGTFTFDTTPEDSWLSLTHLTSSGGSSYSPINISINGNLIANCFDPGNTSYVTNEWNITSYSQQGSNTIELRFCSNATTPYWIKELRINSSFEPYPLDPIFDVGGDLQHEWNYSGNFNATETVSDFSEDIIKYLNNTISHNIVRDEGDEGGTDAGIASFGYLGTYCNYAFYGDCLSTAGVLSSEEVFKSSRDIIVDKISLNVEVSIDDSSWFIYDIYICDVDSEDVRYNTESNCTLVYDDYNFSSSFGTGWNNITFQNSRNLSKSQLYKLKFLYNNSGSGTDFIRLYSDYPKSNYRYFIYTWDEETSHNLYNLYRDIIFYGNARESSPGIFDIPLAFSSDGVGILESSGIEVYYEIIDGLPNVTLISPSDNNISTTGNITFVCNVTDDEGLSNVTLYTNINGTWQANRTKAVTGTSNSTTFTINNTLDDISFIWNCLAYDDESKRDWADSNFTINVSIPNTVPIIINLTQYPVSLYRGEDMEIRCAVEDVETTNSSLNVSIQYQNSTNNGYIGCENITYDLTNKYWRCNYTINYSDDDLGDFDFRCNVSDGELSSGWTTDINTLTTLNNPPTILSCQDDSIFEDTNGSGIQIDLDDCSLDLEDSDDNLVYQINNQTNPSLISCFLNGSNITCNNPLLNGFGQSYIEIQVNDSDGGTNISSPLILISINPVNDLPVINSLTANQGLSYALGCSFNVTNIEVNQTLTVNVTWFKNNQPWTEDDEVLNITSGQINHTSSIGNIEFNDTNEFDEWICSINSYDNTNWTGWLNSTEVSMDDNKFIIQNSSGSAVAWMGDSGNILLRGTCFISTNCTAPSGSFIIQNSTGDTTAYIGSDGNLCIETGDCSDFSTSCNPTVDAFIIQNSSSVNMSYIDSDGDLCLTGRLYENVVF